MLRSAHPCWIDTDLVRDARSDLPSFTSTLARFPPPFSTITSVDACADALVRAIERQQRKVYCRARWRCSRCCGTCSSSRPSTWCSGGKRGAEWPRSNRRRRKWAGPSGRTVRRRRGSQGARLKAGRTSLKAGATRITQGPPEGGRYEITQGPPEGGRYEGSRKARLKVGATRDHKQCATCGGRSARGRDGPSRAACGQLRRAPRRLWRA